MCAGRVLIVEDNDALAENLFEYLEPLGYVLDRAADGVTGLHLAVVNEYDLIVLDWMLPGMDGLEVCRRLRIDADKDTPVLMLTAKDSTPDKLAGFGAGADDYLVKPFDLSELAVRIRSLLGRASRRSKKMSVGDLEFHVGTLRATRSGQALGLSRAGERMLEVLMRRYPNVIKREELEQVLWGDDPPDTDALRSHVYALRNAIDKPFEHKMLETVHRFGYRLVAPGD